MKDIKEQTIKELIDELNRIDEKRNKLDKLEKEIIYELWYRIPELKKSELFQPKGKVKTKTKED